MPTTWPTFTYETLPWESDPDLKALIPKSARRRILPSYEAAVPPYIAELTPVVPRSLALRISQLTAELVRFDAEQLARGFDLPALVLRSESAASSQIEHLTSSVRNVALAEISPKAPRNAKLIAGNVRAMRTALDMPGVTTPEVIRHIHSALMGEECGLRTEQVWIGGRPYSPHGANYVAPHFTRVPELLSDLAAFASRDDVEPLVKSAVAHAQFESIHPFIDGNGRTGRALAHRMLRADGVLANCTLPISAGLLHDIDRYKAALDAYHEGACEPIVECFADALEIALTLGSAAAIRIEKILAAWGDSLAGKRAGASIHKLPPLLVEQPVVDTAYAAEALGITTRAASTMLQHACGLGILQRVGSKKRGVIYQAAKIIDVLEELNSGTG